MNRNNFNENFFFGVKKYRHLLEILYKRICHDGRYVFIDKSRFSTLVQRQLKTDTVIQRGSDVSNGIEEKVASWPERKGKPHTAFFLETRSCTNPGHESVGWMKTSCADYLLYAFEIKGLGLDIYIIDFPLLQKWFEDIAYHSSKYPFHSMPDENRTEGKLVNIVDVCKHIPTKRFLITFEGVFKPLKLGVDILSLLLWNKTNTMLAQIAQREEAVEDEPEEEAVEDWREVQNRVEEILAQQEAEKILQWAEQMEVQNGN